MTYTIVAKWRAREGEPRISKIFSCAISQRAEEPGNLQFTVHRSSDDPKEFLLYEQYKNETAFIEHQQTAHFNALVLERAVPLLELRERRAYSDFE